ncbi:MAG: RNA methyltransferase [Alphaproteobacteria bacterium]|nr:RNA methyltransferase [Alphaproteobacteria bacterium]
MAGTDRSKEPVLGGPVVVLVEPQLGENIGTSARAMLNGGLTELRLVRPRDGWPNAKATAAAAGADAVIEGARLFDSTAAAIADCRRVYATTARRRDMIKPVLSPARAASEIHAASTADKRCAVLFGPERRGLTNDDVALSDAAIEVDLNPAFRSLNLAQAVLLVSYEWYRASRSVTHFALPIGTTRPATKAELLGFFEHLEGELDRCGFLQVKEKRPTMVRNIRNMFQRANLTEQEVRTLRGIVTGLSVHGPAALAKQESGDLPE